MEIQNIPIAEVFPSPMNPRKTFDEDSLKELADNIRQQGLLQPIKVRPKESGAAKYEIVYGERRYRALKSLNAEDAVRWPTIAAIVREMDDKEAFDEMITENLQRKDVDPIEEAFAFGQLLERGDTAEEIAARFGKTVRFVQDRVKLNNLIPELLLKVREGKMALVAAMMIAKFDEEGQRKFLSGYGNYEVIGKEMAQRFVDNQFMVIGRASWSEADPDYAGGCGRKCSDCPCNTANANCLFWEMKTRAEDGKCTSRRSFESKHMAYALDFLSKMDGEMVRKGDTLEYGKTVVADNANCWNPDLKRMHDEVINAIAAKGYEVVNPDDVLGNRVHYPDGDERVAQLVRNGEAYRCVSFFDYVIFPTPKIVYFYLKPKSKETTGQAGEVAPAEVVTLAAKHKRNVELCQEALAKKYTELAASVSTVGIGGRLCGEEQLAFDLLILRELDAGFFTTNYQRAVPSKPSAKELLEIAAAHPEDRERWYREFLRKHMATTAYPESANTVACANVLPVWRKSEFEEIGRETLDSFGKKNEKIRARLEELGYGVDGKKLVERVEAASDGREPLKVRFDEMKRNHPDAVLLFRVGDYYEAFADDAKFCAEVLRLKTMRKPFGKELTAVCGFPHHALEECLPKLVRSGKRVAICENNAGKNN